MNDSIKISELFDLNETIAADIFDGCTFPWEVLSKIGDFILKLGNTLPESEYEKEEKMYGSPKVQKYLIRHISTDHA